MITGLDFLYICLGVGFLVLVGILSFTLFSIATFFTTLKIFIKEINITGMGMKMAGLNFLKQVLQRGGDRHE